MRFTLVRIVMLFMASVALGCEKPGPGPVGGSANPPQLGVGGGRAPSSSPPELPDFIITGVRVNPPGPIVAPGTKCKLSFTVRNQGRGDWHGNVRVSVAGNFGGMITGGLRAGQSKVAVASYPVYSRGATVRFTGTVDPDNVIKEAREDNNSSRVVTITTHR